MRGIARKLTAVTVAASLIFAMILPVLSENVVVAAAATTFDIFHDQGGEYISTIEPTIGGDVVLRLRTEKDKVSEAYLQWTYDKSKWTQVSMNKAWVDTTGYYQIWSYKFTDLQQQFYYRFVVKGTDGSTYYYSAEGTTKTTPDPGNSYTLIPGMSTPDWAKGTLWYSIQPDSFYNGNVLNDVSESWIKKALPWGSEGQGLQAFYGGDIEGIISKIQYIKSLGVESLYLNPVWTSDSRLGYGPNHLMQVAANYGNEEDLAELCQQVQGNGMQIMLDSVMSYSPLNSIYVDNYGHQPLTGALESEASIYSQMLEFTTYPLYKEKWGGISNNLGNSQTQQLFWKSDSSVLKSYLKAPYSINGWRFDATSNFEGTDENGNAVGTAEVAKDIRASIKEANPNTILMAEDNIESEIMSGVWDSTWNKWFANVARQWFDGTYQEEALASDLVKMLKYPRAVGLCMFNQYDQHDLERLAADNNTEKNKLRAIQLLLMTYVGSPCIYYGDEIGMVEGENCFNWNTNEWNQDTYALHCALGQLRKDYTALKSGVMKVGLADDEKNLLVFGRWDTAGTVVTMLNPSDTEQQVTLDLKQYNIKDNTVVTDYLTGDSYTVRNGCATVKIPAGGSLLVTGSAAATVSSETFADAPLFDTFDGSSELNGMLLTDLSAGSTQTFESNALVVDAAVNPSLLLSAPRSSDFTFRAAVKNVENGVGGVVSYADAGNGVALVYDKDNGELVFGYWQDGELLPNEIIAVANGTDIELQIQRIGTVYTAVYTMDGVTRSFETKLPANMSIARAGILCKGKAAFDYVTFGNSIYDGNSTNTPISLETEIVPDIQETTDSRVLEKYSIIGDESEWQYALGGIERTVSNGFSQMAVDKLYKNFKVQCTLLRGSGSGNVGIELLRSTAPQADSLGDGYILALDAGNNLILTKDGVELARCLVSGASDTGVKLTIVRMKKQLCIYVGQNSQLFAEISDVATEEGYIRFYMDNAAGHINNYSVQDYDAAWVEALSPYAQCFVKDGAGIRVKENHKGEYALAIANVKGIAFTRAEVAANVAVKQHTAGQKAYAGLLFGTAQGASPVDAGVMVSLDSEGTVSISKKGEVKDTVSLGNGVTEVSMQVAVNAGDYLVYLNGAEEPALSWSDDSDNGGVVSLVSENSETSFHNLEMRDCTNTADLEEPQYDPHVDELCDTAGDVPDMDGFYYTTTLKIEAGKTLQLCSRENGYFLSMNRAGYQFYTPDQKTVVAWTNDSTFNKLDTGLRLTVYSSRKVIRIWADGKLIIDKSVHETGKANPNIRWHDSDTEDEKTIMSGTQIWIKRVEEPTYHSNEDTLYEVLGTNGGTWADKVLTVGKNVNVSIQTDLPQNADYYCSMNLKSTTGGLNLYGRETAANAGVGAGISMDQHGYKAIPDGIWTNNTDMFNKLASEKGIRITIHSTEKTFQVWADGVLVVDEQTDAQPTISAPHLYSMSDKLTVSDIQIWVAGKELTYDCLNDSNYEITEVSGTQYESGILTMNSTTGKEAVLGSALPTDVEEYCFTMILKSSDNAALNLYARKNGTFINLNKFGQKFYRGSSSPVRDWINDDIFNSMEKTEGLRVTVCSARDRLRMWANGHLILDETVQETGDARPEIKVLTGSLSVSDVQIWTRGTANWMDISEYKANSKYPTKEGGVFAGWYTSGTEFTPETAVEKNVTEGEYFALFVDKNVLRAAWQVNLGKYRTDKKTDLRLVTTVDSLSYRNVGFQVKYGGQLLKTNSENNVVYNRLAGWDGSVRIEYLPTDFSPESKYFMAYRINNIPEDCFNTEFEVTPYWTTMDGTKVTGQATTFKIKDEFGLNEGDPDQEGSEPW